MGVALGQTKRKVDGVLKGRWVGEARDCRSHGKERGSGDADAFELRAHTANRPDFPTHQSAAELQTLTNSVYMSKHLTSVVCLGVAVSSRLV